MCLVVLLQATSVLAHRRPHGVLSLPLCDEERSNLNKIDSLVIIYFISFVFRSFGDVTLPSHTHSSLVDCYC